MRFRSKMLSGSGKRLPGFSRESFTRKPRFRHQSCTRLYYFVIDILPVSGEKGGRERWRGEGRGGEKKKKGTRLSAALRAARATRCALQYFHSRHVSPPKSTEFPSNAQHLALNANFRSRFALSVQRTRNNGCAFSGKRVCI